jgi:hypothetical protein
MIISEQKMFLPSCHSGFWLSPHIIDAQPMQALRKRRKSRKMNTNPTIDFVPLLRAAVSVFPDLKATFPHVH